MTTPSGVHDAARLDPRTLSWSWSLTRRHEQIVIAMMMLLIAGVTAATSRYGTSWHYFRDAAHAIIRPDAPGPEGGLDVYTSHPEFQFGPLSIVVAVPFTLLPAPFAMIAVAVFALALGIVAILAIIDPIGSSRRPGGRRRSLAMLIGVCVASAAWTDIAVRTAHIDDAIALASTCLALRAAERGRASSTMILLAIAAASKPWAIVFLPLVMVPPGRWRWGRLVVVCGAVALTWLPFVIDDPATVSAASAFKISNAAASGLRVLGVHSSGTPPWDRPTQIVLGLAVAAWLVRTNRPRGVVMAALGVRLMLDPAVHHYYSAGLTLGVFMWERRRGIDNVPWATIGTFTALELSASAVGSTESSVGGVVRLVVTAAAVLAAVTLGERDSVAL